MDLTPFRRAAFWNLQGEEADVEIEIDANQSLQSPISLKDGPVESTLWSEDLGWRWRLRVEMIEISTENVVSGPAGRQADQKWATSTL